MCCRYCGSDGVVNDDDKIPSCSTFIQKRICAAFPIIIINVRCNYTYQSSATSKYKTGCGCYRRLIPTFCTSCLTDGKRDLLIDPRHSSTRQVVATWPQLLLLEQIRFLTTSIITTFSDFVLFISSDDEKILLTFEISNEF